MDDGLHHVDVRMADEQRERVANHRGALHIAILLGPATSGPRAAASRQHHRRYPVRHRFGLLAILLLVTSAAAS